MSLIGTIDPYVPGTSFSNYVERLEYFFSCNNVDDGRKKDIFMSFCGMIVFDELKLLYPATDLRTLTYAEITKKLKERYDKVESDIILRLKFRRRVQGPNELGENFILAVKLLAEQCDFGAFRDSAIRDQLVFGVHDEKVLEKLVQEDDLTLRKAEKIIKNKEMATSTVQVISQENNVHSVRYRLGNKEERSGYG